MPMCLNFTWIYCFLIKLSDPKKDVAQTSVSQLTVMWITGFIFNIFRIRSSYLLKFVQIANLVFIYTSVSGFSRQQTYQRWQVAVIAIITSAWVTVYMRHIYSNQINYFINDFFVITVNKAAKYITIKKKGKKQRTG